MKIESRKHKTILTAGLLPLNLALLAGIVYIIHNTVDTDVLPTSPISLGESKDIYKQIIVGCFIAPVLEELAFRLHLSGIKQDVYISVFACALIFFAITVDESILSFKVIASSFTVLILFILLFKKIYYNLSISLRRLYKSNLPILILLSTSIFSFLHVADLSSSSVGLKSLIVLMLPSFVTGLILAAIRVICGIGYSIAFHCTHNAILIIPSILLLSR